MLSFCEAGMALSIQSHSQAVLENMEFENLEIGFLQAASMLLGKQI